MMVLFQFVTTTIKFLVKDNFQMELETFEANFGGSSILKRMHQNIYKIHYQMKTALFKICLLSTMKITTKTYLTTKVPNEVKDQL